MNLATFFQNYPLYRRFPLTERVPVNALFSCAVQLQCASCKGERTYRAEQPAGSSPTAVSRALDFITGTQIYNISFFCASCEKSTVHILVRMADDCSYLAKIGQFPPWAPPGDKAFLRDLGESKELYERGNICESQGYGIGAFAYYRRVVETTIAGLLDQIRELVPAPDRLKYEAALANIASQHSAADKLRIVKDLLPETLRPNGHNPLDVLYSHLSDGIHARGDEECLEHADSVRSALQFLLTQVRTHRVEARAFSDSVQALLDKKAERGS